MRKYVFNIRVVAGARSVDVGLTGLSNFLTF